MGVAITDPERRVAFPRGVFSGSDLKALKKLVADEKVELIVVGLPLSLSGKKTDQTRETEAFIEEVKTWGVPVETMDERLTTVQAHRTGGDDAVAAQILLKTYLDKHGKIRP